MFKITVLSLKNIKMIDTVYLGGAFPAIQLSLWLLTQSKRHVTSLSILTVFILYFDVNN